MIVIRIVGGAVLMAIGLLLISTGIGLDISGSNFVDTYPVNDNWGNSGSHQNTISDINGNLEISNLSTNELDTGTFTSDVITKSDLELSNIVYEASNIKSTGTGQRLIELEVRGVTSQGAILDQVEYNLTNGRFSLDPQALQDERYGGYQFVFNLEAEDDTTPEVNELEIQGDAFEQDSSLFSRGLGFLLLFIGFMVVIKDVF